MSFRIKPAAVAGIIILCGVLASGSFYFYLRSHARQIFNAQVSALTRRHVEVQRIEAKFPATLLIEGLQVDGLIYCPQVRVVIDLVSLLGRDMRLAALELDHPILTLEQAVDAASLVNASSAPVPTERSLKMVKLRSIILSSLVVRNGTFMLKKHRAQDIVQTFVLIVLNCMQHGCP
ncbi:MAG: hypothetical protein HQL17_08770 [Candidatus Omnitrophica bacterium]|nr:hypothetical protein [Candidatus Omnitrophota bacterium]